MVEKEDIGEKTEQIRAERTDAATGWTVGLKWWNNFMLKIKQKYIWLKLLLLLPPYFLSKMGNFIHI